MATKEITKEKASASASASKRTQLSGVVTSDKMKDTVVVQVARFMKHPKYGKFVSIHKKFKAHDAGNTKKVGDKVTIEECAPISKDKHFRIVASS